MTTIKSTRDALRRRARVAVEVLEERWMPAALALQYYPITTELTAPTSIVTGSDGNIWFTTSESGGPGESGFIPAVVGEVNLQSTVVSTFIGPNGGNAGFGSIINGPGGQLWFTDNAGLASFNMTTHVFTEYSLGITNSDPAGVTLGPDGNLWFTDPNNNAVGMFNPNTGKAGEFAMPQSNQPPTGIVTGPDGNIWFGYGKPPEGGIPAKPGGIGRINPATDAITTFPLSAGPSGIAVGSDGNIWFTYFGAVDNIGNVNPTSGAVTQFELDELFPEAIVTGPGGDLWTLGSGLLSIDPVSHVAIPYGVGGSNTIADGPGSNSIWYGAGKYIVSAKVIPSTQSAISGQVYLDPTGTGTTANGIIPNATVYLDLNGDGRFDAGDPVTSATPFGSYSFVGLTPGTYTVRLVPYPGNIATSPVGLGQSVTVAGGENATAGPLGMLPTSVVLPLNVNRAPYGSDNPDIQTAEVNGQYELILGRVPDPSGGAAAVAYLKTGGSLAQLATDLFDSVEYESKLVATYYQTFLRRSGSAAEISNWVNAMQVGLTEEQVASDFLNSTEYSDLFPANATFVQALYGDVLAGCRARRSSLPGSPRARRVRRKSRDFWARLSWPTGWSTRLTASSTIARPRRRNRRMSRVSSSSAA